MKKKVILLSEDANIPYNENKIEKNVLEILDFETKIAEIIVSENERRNLTKMYNLHFFSILSNLFDVVNNLKNFIL